MKTLVTLISLGCSIICNFTWRRQSLWFHWETPISDFLWRPKTVISSKTHLINLISFWELFCVISLGHLGFKLEFKLVNVSVLCDRRLFEFKWNLVNLCNFTWPSWSLCLQISLWQSVRLACGRSGFNSRSWQT